MFSCVSELLLEWQPREPVYCLSPKRYAEAAASFLEGFPGRVLYAVKANDDPGVLTALHQAGIRHFDCASLPEIHSVKALDPDAACYFMTPLRLRGAARSAAEDFGVRHFLVDDPSGLEQLCGEIDPRGKVIFARMAVKHPDALMNFAHKFGADPKDVPALMSSIRRQGAEPALAFNVGSTVVSPRAYSEALLCAGEVLAQLEAPVRLLDIGGGFPLSYPEFDVPPHEDYFSAIGLVARSLPLAVDAQLLAEPGRALAAPGLSAIVEVLLRKDQRLYLNDGMYGIFWELRFEAHRKYRVDVYRDGQKFVSAPAEFSLFGPTCDGSDAMPGTLELPSDIRAGDYLHVHEIGAYSLTGRTRFNGHYSDRIVTLSGSG